MDVHLSKGTMEERELVGMARKGDQDADDQGNVSDDDQADASDDDQGSED